MRRIRDDRLKRSTIASPEEILEALTLQMRTLPNELVDRMTGCFIPLKDMTRDQAQAIAGFKFKRRTYESNGNLVVEDTIEYKLVDRLRAADMLAKHHGLYDKDNQQKAVENQHLVAYPVGEMTLEEWQRQALIILEQARAALPAPG
jgi:hypothetical protein